MAYWRSALAALTVLLLVRAISEAAGPRVGQEASPAVTGPAGGKGNCATARVLPPTGSVAGWQLRETPRAYTPDNLYEYIDGNADLFLSYGFADAAVGDYAPAKLVLPPSRTTKFRCGGRRRRSEGASPLRRVAGEGWVSVEVYNMGTPLQAFGIFGAEKPAEAKRATLGTQGYESDGLIAFWKGPYYVKVSLIEGDDASAARQLAARAAERTPSSAAAELRRPRRRIAADPSTLPVRQGRPDCNGGTSASGSPRPIRAPERGGAGPRGEPAMPAEIARLPLASRIPDSERYLKTGALGHKFLLEAVSASYQLGDNIAMLSIADLATPGKAAEGMVKLREFEAGTGGSIAELTGVGEDAFVRRRLRPPKRNFVAREGGSGTSSPAKADGFAVRDPYYGEMVVARAGQFVVIGLSEKATRGTVEGLVAAGVVSASVGAHGPSALRPAQGRPERSRGTATLRVNDAPPPDAPTG